MEGTLERARGHPERIQSFRLTAEKGGVKEAKCQVRREPEAENPA